MLVTIAAVLIILVLAPIVLAVAAALIEASAIVLWLFIHWAYSFLGPFAIWAAWEFSGIEAILAATLFWFFTLYITYEDIKSRRSN